MDTANLVERFRTACVSLLTAHGHTHLPPMPLSAQTLLAWAALEETQQTVVWVSDGPQTLEHAHRDLVTIAGTDSTRLLYYPAWESLPGQGVTPERETSGCRFSILLDLLAERGEPLLVATCVQALMQRTLEPDALRARTAHLSVGDELELDELRQHLSDAGYTIEAEAFEKGQAAIRGGLLDVWPPTEPLPLRVEFFGPVLESIRAFDPTDQRSTGKRSDAAIPPVDEWSCLSSGGKRGAGHTLLDYLPKGVHVVWSDMPAIHDRAVMLEEAAEETGAGQYVLPMDDVCAHLGVDGRGHQLLIGSDEVGALSPDAPDIAPCRGVFDLPARPLQPDLMEEMRKRFLQDLMLRVTRGYQAAVFLDTPGAREHFTKTLTAHSEVCADADRLSIELGALSEGFVSDELKLIVVAESDLYGRRKQLAARYMPTTSRSAAREYAGERVADLTDIDPGDLVVHVDHGLGRYLGLFEIEFNGQRQEVLSIEYAEGAKLHVPTSHAHLLSRYVGMSKRSARLHRLGGRRWKREKDAATRAIRDLASSLLETQAHRELLNGHAFGDDAPWQHEFEAAFPYRETPDQARAIELVKADMHAPKPMDRLICGDAGYGKTEVAMRAAFKAVMAGKQVAVLVPTTVLAQQHYDTFSERMAPYPVRIEMLSRFRSRGEQRRILEELARGSIDIVIGTHALVQPHVAFKDLGLAVIDEEQRFGVAHKERLKQMRQLVDVLTLTATPIPRTMYMSLTGVRDMSLLQTPPRERVPIETIVTRYDDKVVREAILREVSREGQVYYLHNRVMTIDWAYDRLKQLVPEVSIGMAHGQMASGELARVMHAFAGGQFDVLLCTTIVESGVDIPRANTILIDRADRFGIADLYQLRGRVGRANHKAYAYLMTPARGRILTDARKRIGAVRQFSSLGAGFNLALRDLEIRGAGNILGAEQSGNITAIGFGLYCQLLQRTVASLKGEPLPPIVEVDVRLTFINLSPGAEDTESAAMVPYDYIEDERLRVVAYRRIAEATSIDNLEELVAEFRDRFGPVPRPVSRLLKIARLRLLAHERGIDTVETRGDKLMLRTGNDYVMHGARFPRLQSGTPDDRLEEIEDLIVNET